MSAETPSTPAPRKGGRRTVAEIRAEVESELEASFSARMQAMQEEFDKKLAELSAEKEAKPAPAATTGPEPVTVQAEPPDLSDVEADPDKPNSVTVHFVDDGFTIFGKVWYRGEELTVQQGTPQWEEASIGNIMLLTMTEAQQVARWEKRFFAPGPWPYDNPYQIDKAAYTRTDDEGNEVFDQAAYEKDLQQLETIQNKRKIRAATPGPKKSRRIFS